MIKIKYFQEIPWIRGEKREQRDRRAVRAALSIWDGLIQWIQYFASIEAFDMMGDDRFLQINSPELDVTFYVEIDGDSNITICQAYEEAISTREDWLIQMLLPISRCQESRKSPNFYFHWQNPDVELLVVIGMTDNQIPNFLEKN